MPFFRYSAKDSAGATMDGTIEASTPDDAMLLLVRQGLTVQQIMKTAAPAPVRPGSPVAKPQAQPQAQTARPIAKSTPSPPPVAVQNVVRTKRVGDQDRMFLFTQLAQQLKAGIGPAESLSDLSQRVVLPLRPALEEASKSAGKGGTISEAFERYPDLFPEHVVGTLRAAEAGGFLPDACTLLTDQAQNAYSFRRWFWFVRPVAINGLIALPVVYLLINTVLKTWNKVELQGEGATTQGTIAAMLQTAGKLLKWPIGPLTLAIWAMVYGSYKLFASPRARRLRHELALRWPVFGPRTRHECLSVFTWVMSRVTKAGISPNRSWELASESVPNTAVRERLERIGRSLTGSEKLSDAVFKENFFPKEYAPMLATAEFTGDFPGAFEQLAKVSQVEFEAAQTSAKMRSSRWGCLAYIIIGGIVMIALFNMLYNQLLPAIVGGD